MRKIYGSLATISPILKSDFNTLSVRFAKVVAPILEKYIYFVTEGIHGALRDKNGKPIIEERRAPNENGDLFFWDELIGDSPIPGMKVYATWINKPVLENHNSKLVRGKIIDTYPDHQRRSVDMLDAVDRLRFQELAKAIEQGRITDTSMGVLVSESECSVCGKKMKDTSEWCDHLRLYKGKRLPATGELVYEISHGLIGLEDSLITVGQGADKDAKIREVLAHRLTQQGKGQSLETAKIFIQASKKLGIPEKDLIDFLKYVKEKNRNKR